MSDLARALLVLAVGLPLLLAAALGLALLLDALGGPSPLDELDEDLDEREE